MGNNGTLLVGCEFSKGTSETRKTRAPALTSSVPELYTFWVWTVTFSDHFRWIGGESRRCQHWAFMSGPPVDEHA